MVRETENKSSERRSGPGGSCSGGVHRSGWSSGKVWEGGVRGAKIS